MSKAIPASSDQEKLKIVFICSSDSPQALSIFEPIIEEAGLEKDKDILFIGDGIKQIKDLLPELEKIKGRTNEKTLFIIYGHANRLMDEDKKKELHFFDSLFTHDLVNRMQVAANHPIEVLGLGCKIGSSVKEGDIENPQVSAFMVSGSGPSSGMEDTISAIWAIQLKAGKFSNRQIFRYISEKRVDKIYFRPHQIEDVKEKSKILTRDFVKLERSGKFTPDHIGKILLARIEGLESGEKRSALLKENELIMAKLNAAKTKSGAKKKSFSINSIFKIIDPENKGLYPDFKKKLEEELRKGISTGEIEKHLVARSKEVFADVEIPVLKDKKSGSEEFGPVEKMLRLALLEDKLELILAIIAENPRMIEEDGVEFFKYAAMSNSPRAVKALIDAGVNFIQNDSSYKNVLSWAAEVGSYEVVKYLITDHREYYSGSPSVIIEALSYAVKSNSEEVSEVLSNYLLETLRKSPSNDPIIRLYKIRGLEYFKKVVEELPQIYNAEIRLKLFEFALEKSDQQALKFFIDNATNSDSKDSSPVQDKFLNEAFLIAMRQGRIEVGDQLVKSGADKNTVFKTIEDSGKALWDAVDKNNQTFTKAILYFYPDAITHLQNNKQTVFFQDYHTISESMMKLLISEVPSEKLKDILQIVAPTGDTALMQTIEFNQPNNARLIINKLIEGKDINVIRDRDLFYCLRAGIFNEEELDSLTTDKMLKVLLEAVKEGSDVDFFSNMLSWLKYKLDKEQDEKKSGDNLYKKLINQVIDADGNTLLMMAQKKGQEGLVELLLSEGANVDTTTTDQPIATTTNKDKVFGDKGDKPKASNVKGAKTSSGVGEGGVGNSSTLQH